MKGADVVFKDVVEPLESVSVTLTKTEKKDITEFGDIQEVAGWHQLQLADMLPVSAHQGPARISRWQRHWPVMCLQALAATSRY